MTAQLSLLLELCKKKKGEEEQLGMLSSLQLNCSIVFCKVGSLDAPY